MTTAQPAASKLVDGRPPAFAGACFADHDGWGAGSWSQPVGGGLARTHPRRINTEVLGKGAEATEGGVHP